MKTLLLFALALRGALSGTFCQMQTGLPNQTALSCRELVCPFEYPNATTFSATFFGKPIGIGDEFIQTVLRSNEATMKNPEDLKKLATQLAEQQSTVKNRKDGNTYQVRLLAPDPKKLCFIKTPPPSLTV